MGRHIRSAAAALQPQAAAQQLDAVAVASGDLHILQINAGDALHGHLRRVHLMSKGQIRQNTNFAAGVDALHVRRGVRLRVALLLRQLQNLGK